MDLGAPEIHGGATAIKGRKGCRTGRGGGGQAPAQDSELTTSQPKELQQGLGPRHIEPAPVTVA